MIKRMKIHGKVGVTEGGTVLENNPTRVTYARVICNSAELNAFDKQNNKISCELPAGLGAERREHRECVQTDVGTAQAGLDLSVSVWNLQGALWGLEAETARGVFVHDIRILANTHIPTHARSVKRMRNIVYVNVVLLQNLYTIIYTTRVITTINQKRK